MRFPWQERKAEEQREAIRSLFLRVFGSDDGKQVLTIILEDLHFYDPSKMPSDAALSEYAKFLLTERLGARDSYAATEALLGAAINASMGALPVRRSNS